MEVWRRKVKVFWESGQASRLRGDEKTRGAVSFPYSFQVRELCCVKIGLLEPSRKAFLANALWNRRMQKRTLEEL